MRYVMLAALAALAIGCRSEREAGGGVHGDDPPGPALGRAENPETAAPATESPAATNCFESWDWVPQGLEGRSILGAVELRTGDPDGFLLTTNTVAQSVIARELGKELADLTPNGTYTGHKLRVHHHWLFKWRNGSAGFDGKTPDHPNTYVLIAESDLSDLPPETMAEAQRHTIHGADELATRHVLRAEVLALAEPGGLHGVFGGEEAERLVKCLAGKFRAFAGAGH